MPRRLGNHAIEDIRRTMSGRSGAEARTAADTLAAQYGVSTGTIYSVTREVRPKRKRRADAGSREFDPAAAQVFRHLTVGKGLSVRQARELMQHNGYYMPSVATLARSLGDDRLGARDREKDLTPAVRFEAPYPNRMWQVDASGSSLFYLDADGSVEYINPIKYTKNKPAPKKPRVWMIAVIDDHSRAAYAEIVPANDTQCWLSVIANAAAEKGSVYPICGLPEQLYTDNDSVVKSARFQRVLSLFNPPIESVRHLPTWSRATGKVERFFGTLERQFEAVHAAAHIPGLDAFVKQGHHQPTRWKTLDDANRYLRAWLIEYNNRPHSELGCAPFARWMANIHSDEAGGPRLIPEEVLRGTILVDETERQVNRDLTISLNNARYALPRQEPFLSMIGRTLRIWWSPELAEVSESAVWVDVEGESYELRPAGQPVPWGQFAAIPLSRRDVARREIARAEDPKVVTRSPAEIEREAPRYVRGRGAYAEVPDAPVPTVVMRTRSQALSYLRDQRTFHTPVEPHEREAFDAMWTECASGDSIAVDELKRWARHWSAGYRQAASGGA